MQGESLLQAKLDDYAAPVVDTLFRPFLDFGCSETAFAVSSMVDVVSKTDRARMMSGIRGKNTKPELLIRRFLHSFGFRYNLHERALPGCPDLVLKRYRAVVFVHGCFWHRHEECKYAATPATRPDFWMAKLEGNRNRDEMARQKLLEMGWRVAVVWECALRHELQATLNGLRDFILSDRVCQSFAWTQGAKTE